MQAHSCSTMGPGSSRPWNSVPLIKRRRYVQATAAQSHGQDQYGQYRQSSPATGYHSAPRQQPAQPTPQFSIPFLYNPPQEPQPAAPVDGAFKASGKTVVITGASQGIGRATALLFARKGFNVVLAARDPTKLRYVAEDCAEAAGRQGAAFAVPTDVTDERQVKDLVNASYARYESIDVVINNAGVFAKGAFTDTPVAEARRLMETNYLGAYIVTQSFLSLLVKQAQRKRGLYRPSIVMVNSFASQVPLKHMSAFTASKYALEGLTSAIRVEVEPLGVHVGQVHPGLVKSSLMEEAQFYGDDSQDDRRMFRQMLRTLPLSQSPQEVASAIYSCAVSKQSEVMVGLPFQAAAQAFKMTGLNPSALV